MNCAYVHTRGAKRGRRCEVYPRGGQAFCHEHRATDQAKHGGVPPDEVKAAKTAAQMEKLHADPLFSGPESARKAPAAKERSSIWLVTINSNQTFDNMSEADRAKFKRFIEYLYDNVTDFLRDKGDQPAADVIDTLETDHHFELSSQGHLHSHGIIKITHHGHLTLQANVIRGLGRKIMGHSIYLNCPVSGDPIASWERYIAKGGEPVDL